MMNLKNLMLRKNKENLGLELGLKQARLVLGSEVLAEQSLSCLTDNEDAYLESLSSFLRDELRLLESKEKMGLEIVLDLDMLMLVDFTLPVFSRQEEKEQIAWEVAESVPRKKDSFYYKVWKGKKNAAGNFEYIIYTVTKSFADKLVGMAHGFGLEVFFISPRLEQKTSRELEKYDLYPDDLKDARFSECMNQYAKKLLRLSLALALFFTFFMEGWEYCAKREERDIDFDLGRLILWQQNRAQAQKIIDDIKKAKMNLKFIENTTAKQSEFLEALGRSTSLGLWVTGVESVGTEYKVYGISRDMLGINAWCEELTINSAYKGTRVLSTESKDEGLGFVVRVSKEKEK